MPVLLDILAITTPIYLVILIGYIATRQGLFQRAEMRVFGQFVLNLALPALLFSAVSQLPLRQVLRPDYLLVYALGTVTMVLVGRVAARVLMPATLRSSPQQMAGVSTTMAMGMSCPNSGFVGFPILLLTMPALAGPVLAQNMLVENLLVIPLLLALGELGKPVLAHAADQSGHTRATPAWAQVVIDALARTARNPLVIALMLGLAFAWIGPVLPKPVMKTIGLFAQASSALSLFVIGGSLAGLSVRGMGRQVAPIVVGKLIVHPLLVALALWLLQSLGWVQFSDDLRLALILTAAMPIMGIYPILAQRYGQDGLAAAAQLATTVLSFVSINGLLWVMRG